MEKVIVVGYSEIALKGRNRQGFEQRLVDNIRACLNLKGLKILRFYGRIYVHTAEKAIPALRKVFGIHSMAYSVRVHPDLETLKSAIRKLIMHLKFESFRMSVRRVNKQFPIKSMELNSLLGAFVVELTGAKVRLKHYGLNIFVEIADAAYIYFEKVPAHGGLPVGSQGSIAVKLDTEEDALAAILMMKRGCMVKPYGTTKLRLLEAYALKPLESRPIGELQAEPAVCVGDCCGLLGHYDFPVFKPLIGLTSSEIKKLKLEYF